MSDESSDDSTGLYDDHTFHVYPFKNDEVCVYFDEHEDPLQLCNYVRWVDTTVKRRGKLLQLQISTKDRARDESAVSLEFFKNAEGKQQIVIVSKLDATVSFNTDNITEMKQENEDLKKEVETLKKQLAETEVKS